MKSKPIISLFQTMKTLLLDFYCLGLFFPLYFMNSRLKVLPKRFNVVYLSQITVTTLTFRDRTDDVTYCAHITLFLQATSVGLSLTSAFFFLGRFLAFYCFECYLGSFSRCKNVFSPIIIPINTLNKTKLTRNG